MTTEEKYTQSSIKSCEILRLERMRHEQYQSHLDAMRLNVERGTKEMAIGDVEKAIHTQIEMRAISYIFALSLVEQLYILMARIEPDDEVMAKVREIMRPKDEEVDA